MAPFGNTVNSCCGGNWSCGIGHKVMVQTLQWLVLVEAEGLQHYQEDWCLFLDAFVEFLTMA